MGADVWRLAEVSGLAVLAWLVTYALHSTVILGGAYLVSRRMSVSSARLREKIWKLALIGALITPSLQLGLGLEPFGGRWSLFAADSSGAVTAVAPLATAGGTGPDAGTFGEPQRVATTAWKRPAPVAGQPPSFGASVASLERILTPRLVGAWVLAVWSCFGALTFMGLAIAWLRLTAGLRGRREVVRGPWVDSLRELTRRMGYRRRVRLTVAPALHVPISKGWLRPEICLPPRALTELGVEEQEALLAHELGHLVRRDPVWVWLLRIVQGVFFFQPLNRVARREIEDCAELLCDAWAVQHTGLRLSLASCLTQVADWVVAGQPLLAPAMARRRSRLAVRVESLLDEAHAERFSRRSRAHALAGPLAFGLCAALVFVVPAVSSQAPRAEPEGLVPASPPVVFPVREQAPTETRAVTRPATGTVDLAGDLELLVHELDEELDELDREFAALRSEIARDDPEGLLTPSLILVERKLAALRARRGRLAQIVGGLPLADPVPQASGPLTPNPRTTIPEVLR